MSQINVVLVHGDSIFTTDPPGYLHEVIIASSPNSYYTIPAHCTGYIKFITFENEIRQTRYATLKAEDSNLIIDSNGYSLGYFYSDYIAYIDSAYIYNASYDRYDP